jgi:hypothetical protein
MNNFKIRNKIYEMFYDFEHVRKTSKYSSVLSHIYVELVLDKRNLRKFDHEILEETIVYTQENFTRRRPQ